MGALGQPLRGASFNAVFRVAGRGGHDSGVAVLAIVLRFTLWVLVILAVVWIVREVIAAIRSGRAGAPRPALAELEMMYARGEVSRADYLSRRADLAGVPPPAPPS